MPGGTVNYPGDTATPVAELRQVVDFDYRLMIDAVSDYAIFLLDTEGRIVSWNAGAKRIKGYDLEDVRGRHFSMFYPPELLATNWPARELEAAKELGRFEDEGWRLRKDGSRFWANIIITKIVDPEGRFQGFCKITRDLSERRKQEEALRSSEERFRLLVEGVKDYAIFMLDPEGHVVSWNSGAQKNKGYEASEIIGKHFSVFYPPDVITSTWPAEELEVARREGRFEVEGWRIRKDGSRFWASVVITALYDDAGRHRGFAKVTRDMTDRRRISALEDEGRRITTFIAMLGHELRNPLAPISNALSIMQLQQIESESVRAARDVIARQLKQMTRLVDDLLDVGRITSGKIHLDAKPVKLRDAVMDAVETADPLMRAKGHSLSVAINDSDLWVSGDRVRLVQAVGNLLTNAAKFTSSGGRVAVELHRVASTAEIRVRDNGQGIAPQDVASVFNLFFQGDQDNARSQGGLGLGLSLVQQIVALHGGDVSAYSSGRTGEGSEFVIRLPTVAKPVDVARIERRPDRAERKRVLVVDDNRDAADTMEMLLRSMGYDSGAVYDGIAAIESIMRDAPDAVFLDIGLPGLSGIEVAERIRAEMPNPPSLVAMTGYGQEKDHEASAAAGFVAHLTKPVDINVLADMLRKVFG